VKSLSFMVPRVDMLEGVASPVDGLGPDGCMLRFPYICADAAPADNKPIAANAPIGASFIIVDLIVEPPRDQLRNFDRALTIKF
jgi:hypothetical protein